MSNPTQAPQSRRAAVARQADTWDRLPPHSIEAEQALLGCCLLAPADSLPAARARLGMGAAFYDLRHQTLWLALGTLEDARKAIDIVTLRQELKDTGQLDEVGGVAYLTELTDATPSAANLPFYLDIVVEKHLMRQMVGTFSQAIGQIYDDERKGDAGTLFAKVEDNVRRLSDSFSEDGAEQDIKSIVLGTLQIVETTFEHRGKGMQNPNTIPTPFPHLNKLMGGGLQRGDMVVVAARPSMGKTSLACDFLLHAALELNRACKFYSLEMQAMPSIALRLMCSQARSTFMDVQQGFVSQTQLQGLLAAGGKLANSKLAIEDRALNEAQIRADARRAVREGCELIVVDYLQIVPPSDRKMQGDMLMRATMVSEAMKAMAKELNVPVLVLSQLSREIDKDRRGGGNKDEMFGRAPQLSDLRNSGSIEQDADVVLMLWKMPEPEIRTNSNGSPNEEDVQKQADWHNYRADKYRPTNLRIAKQRNGPRDMDVELAYEGTCMRFHDFHGGTGKVGGSRKVMGEEIL